MSDRLIAILVVLPFTAAVLCAAMCWICGIYSMIRMTMNRGADAEPHWLIRTNPFNVIFYPSSLTEAGLRHRRRLFGSAIGFVASIAATAIYAFAVKLAMTLL